MAASPALRPECGPAFGTTGEAAETEEGNMPDLRITFPNGQVGLIVRGKLGPTHHPDNMDQHADCILPDGSPMGFFGEVNGRRLNSIGLDMNGAVYDYRELRIHRLYYVDLASAVAYGVVSTVLLVPATATQASKFSTYWHTLDGSPGSFNILGGNCSTHASDAFIASGILTGGIPGLDTPDNLYGQIAGHVSGTVSHTGFVGFEAKPGGGYDLVIRPYTMASPTPRARGGSSS